MGRRRLFRSDGAGRIRTRPWRRAMVFSTSAALALGLSALPAQGQPERPERPGDSGTSSGESAGKADTSPVNVLVYHGAAGDQDDPVGQATQAIKDLGAEHGFAVEESTDPSVFSKQNLSDYRGVVFLSAAGAGLNASQEDALEAYIEDGGGFLGIRDAAKAQERSEWFTGLIGTRPVGSLPDPEDVAEVTATGENPPNEVAANLADGDDGTKWLTFNPTATITVQLTEPAAVSQYALTSANDFAGRDPQDWTLQGSTDGQTWTDLDSRSGQDFPGRFLTKDYEFENDQAFQYYRLDITANAGDGLTQLAELQFFAGAATEPPPEIPVQEATVSLVDRQHPANDGLPTNWTRSDKWLNWSPNPIGEVHTIAQVQEKTYDPGEGANGAFHPISWCRDYDGGRSFYTGMGGTADSYAEEKFRSHLLGAIQWTTGMVRGDCQATIGSNYEIQRLTAENKEGQLDQIGEPHGLDIAPDGTVFYIGKAACPSGPIPDWEDENVGLGCGTIHQWNPETKDVKLLSTLDVFGNRGSGDELIKTEEGLVGITLDPDFQDNGWIYIMWMPYESIDKEQRIGQRTVSRLTYDFETQSIDMASRKDLLQWDTQIHSCCHAGGGMDFDSKGNLYVGSGDNNSSRGSSGYSGNNWTKDYKGVSFQDARRTSGNTNNLNGKILRIHPEDDGTYTIPEGNLFPESEDPGDKTRPEIYVMGVRNISTLSIDPETDWLKAAWVGPDAFAPDPELGPAKYETATIITSAGNQGWPYCMGNRQPYRNRSNEDASILTNWYDCDDLKNTSPRNTGLVDIPDARDNMIWYSPGGGGPVYPDREDGSGVPTYDEDDVTYTQPYLRGGGQAIMSGPTYHRAEVNTDSGVAWPSYWEDKWLIGDQTNPNNRVAVMPDPNGIEDAAPPLFAEDLRHIIRAGGGSNELQSWMMDSKFGPDGALYMLDYGGGFFSLTDNQKLIRITYTGGPATPTASASATAVQNKPLTMAFNGERSGGVSYEWDFGDGATSQEANPRHTYEAVGTYTATLTVTYADGETMTTEVEVNVGCMVPDDRDNVWIGDTDTGVPNHVVGEGCTINNLIDDESNWSNHGSFVRHVNDTVRRLQQDGVISGRDKGTISRAAARSIIGTSEHTGYEAIFDGTAESLQGWSQ
ncbi:ThuA domain-containing protein, partial [Haloactinopolyspora alba]